MNRTIAASDHPAQVVQTLGRVISQIDQNHRAGKSEQCRIEVGRRASWGCDSKRTKTNAPIGWLAHTLMGRKGFLPAQRSTRNWYRPYGLMWSYRAGERCARSSGAIRSPLAFSRSITAAM